MLTYESVDENSIDFEYGLADTTSVSVDNERHILKEINKKEQTYYYYKPIEADDFSTLIWYNNGYVYSIDAQFSEDEIIKIAENIII